MSINTVNQLFAAKQHTPRLLDAAERMLMMPDLFNYWLTGRAVCEFTNAMLVLVPEHYAIYRNAGWDRERITRELHAAMVRSGDDVIQGAHGIGEGIDPKRKDEMVNKFWPEGLLIVHAGGQAGLFSACCCSYKYV